MNEKLLNKLIKKATKKTKFEHEMGGFYHEDVFNKKKFAELIVKECVSKIESLELSVGDFVVSTVTEHFGVKE
jgi:hypothetical protein